MSLPFSVKRYLRNLLVTSVQPLCLLLDRNHLLKSVWGEPKDFGLPDLETGMDPGELLDVLEGYAGPEPMTVPFLELPGGMVAHLHLVPSGEDLAVIYLDAREDFDRRRQIQQAAHEYRLLNENQARLLEQLRRAHHQLELKQTQLEEANRGQSRFISHMSHELRTPLASILGYSELLEKELRGKSELHTHLKAIQRGSMHLLSLIENVLDQSLLEVGKVTILPTITHMRRMLEDVRLIFASAAMERHLDLRVRIDAELPRLMEIDEVRIRQILVNLTGNAIKFTRKGSVEIGASWTDGLLQLLVSDTGPGIPAAIGEKIFIPFQRSEDLQKAGAGLGLSISKQLAQIMGGDIVLDTRYERGSRFIVTIPARPSAAPAPNTPQAREATSNSRPEAKTILLAEDDPDIREMLRLLLVDGPYEVWSVDNGRLAVETALERRPDLLIIDMNLPVLRGFTAIRQLRKAGFANPIFAITASADVRDQRAARKAGCDRYLLKPINIGHFMASVKQFLGS